MHRYPHTGGSVCVGSRYGEVEETDALDRARRSEPVSAFFKKACSPCATGHTGTTGSVTITGARCMLSVQVRDDIFVSQPRHCGKKLVGPFNIL